MPKMQQNTIMQFMPNLTLAVTLYLSACCALAQDYAREARYAQEVMSGLVVGDAVQIKAASGREFLGLYTAGQSGRSAIVLAHGVGVQPDFGVIGLLRAKLADLGYTTLAIQMPVQSKEAKLEDYFPPVFPDAADRMAQAAAWLRSKGHTDVVLLSHGMGAWMANEYLDTAHVSTPYKAWIVLGLTGGYSWGMRRYALPILDVYGEQDNAAVLGAVRRRGWALKEASGSKQVRIDGADHHYSGRESALAAAVDAFLQGRK